MSTFQCHRVQLTFITLNYTESLNSNRSVSVVDLNIYFVARYDQLIRWASACHAEGLSPAHVLFPCGGRWKNRRRPWRQWPRRLPAVRWRRLAPTNVAICLSRTDKWKKKRNQNSSLFQLKPPSHGCVVQIRPGAGRFVHRPPIKCHPLQSN
jgi:hypothetical protein